MREMDTFAKDNLPPLEDWPEFSNLADLNYPDQLNCSQYFLDDAVAEGFGDRTVIVTPDHEYSYARLQKDANQIAHVLLDDCGLQPGNRVLLRAPNTYMMAACWFGVIKAGGIAVSTMPLFRAKELAVMIEKAQIKIALCDVRLAEELQSAKSDSMLEQLLLFGDSELEKMMSSKPDTFENYPSSADDTCLIAFTSGTTGTPKGTVHFHRDMLSICRAYSEPILAPTQEDRFIGSPPLAFTFGLGGQLLFPMYARASTILLEQATPDLLLPAIKKYQASIVFTSPTAYRFLLSELQDGDLASVRTCVSAGETLPKPTWDSWKEKTGLEILDGIGSTELLHIFISSRADDIRPGATGKPLTGYQAKVVDDSGNEVAPGTTGKLAVKGPTGCRYLADERQKNYVQNGWNLTGDAYMMDEDGYFWFQARTDDMIISSGYNIAGPEVEAALMAHASVMECAVVGIPDEQRGSLVKALVVLQAGYSGNQELAKELQDFVKNTIAPYKYPRALEFVAELPKTETGKIQRFKLRQSRTAQT
ncbi:MAG: benzoate-CoA ligase family protein [SAR324 cluster bacterium]|nr:benzoate-CoA ligase family protein [SAR324 cluster bacterium]MBL7035974.1 benzoate-CoA ligase family protein [SAR324 cluster bacterium]